MAASLVPRLPCTSHLFRLAVVTVSVFDVQTEESVAAPSWEHKRRDMPIPVSQQASRHAVLLDLQSLAIAYA